MNIKKLNGITTFYFTEDGSFGVLEIDSVVDVKNFKKTDWMKIENCCDSNRQKLAQFIEKKRSGKIK